MNRAGPPATPPAPTSAAVPSAERPDVMLYTDGACSGNPGPGGWGYVIVWNGRELEGSGGDPKTTNNRMELTAAIEGLKALKRPCAVHIHTDSQYVLKGMTEWIAGWRRKGWKNAQGKPVENREYWEALAEQVARHQVKWTWVKGHAGHAYNERVDKLAVAAVPKGKRT